MANDIIHGQLLLAQGQGEQAAVANHLHTLGFRMASLEVVDILNGQPLSPNDGEVWIVSDVAGAISGVDWTDADTPGGPAQDGDLAFFNVGWYLLRIDHGMSAIVASRGQTKYRPRDGNPTGERWGPVEFGRFETVERISARQDTNGDELRVKAFSLTFPAVANTEASVAHSITNLDQIRGVTAWAVNGANKRPVNYLDTVTSDAMWWRVDGTTLYAGASFIASSWDLEIELVYTTL